MKVLVLTSRYTASRDIVGEDFGRQARLFEALKKLGCEIDFFCADYKKLENKNTKLHGINVFVRPFGFFYFFRFFSELKNLLRKNDYGFFIATSDPLWGALGCIIFSQSSKIRRKTKFLYDLHDNYETYSSYRKMRIIRHLHSLAIRRADIVTTVSHSLKNKISAIREKNIFVLQNGVDLKIFRPIERKLSRKKLKLPLGCKIIAYTGSLQKTLGVDSLMRVFGRLRAEFGSIRLLLVGRITKDTINGKEIPSIKNPGIVSFDTLSQQDVAYAINAADVVVIPSPSNEFTKYCFPYKCVEYMACNTPIVATSLSDVSLMLKDYKGSLCAPDNEDDLYKKIKLQLKKGKIDYRIKLEDYTWDKIARKLSKIMEQNS